MRKRLLFVFRTSPYAGGRAREGLDALLAAAVFEQEVAVLFMGDGVLQLLADQQPARGRNQYKMLQSLPLYDVEQVYFSSSTLAQRQISPASLTIPGTLITDADITLLMAAADQIFTF